MVAEALGALLVKARELELIEGFKVGDYGEAISHLQFALDTILFSSTTTMEVFTLKRILRCFQLVSGLKVNLSKRSLVGVG